MSSLRRPGSSTVGKTKVAQDGAQESLAECTGDSCHGHRSMRERHADLVAVVNDFALRPIAMYSNPAAAGRWGS
jgi:hypothetical protein